MKKKNYLKPAIKTMAVYGEPMLDGSITQEMPGTENEGEDDVELGAKPLNHFNVWDNL